MDSHPALNTMPIMTVEQEIRSEIYRALATLGADRKLLAAVGSWGDTLEDVEVMELLEGVECWSAATG